MVMFISARALALITAKFTDHSNFFVEHYRNQSINYYCQPPPRKRLPCFVPHLANSVDRCSLANLLTTQLC